MLKEAIFTAPTIEQAKTGALAELGAPEDADVTIEVLEIPVKKTLGLFGGSPAKVRAYYEQSDHAKTEQYLRTILESLGVFEAEISFDVVEDGLRISISCGDSYGAVIGRRGETLDAIQYLVRLVVNKGDVQYKRVSLNVGDYREKRESTLRALAAKNAAKVKKYGRNVVLDPMNPYERRIIHTTVQEIEGVESHSVGSEDERKVVITPVGGARNNRSNDRGGERRGGYQNRERGGYQRDGDRRPAPRRDSSSAPAANRPPRSDASSAARYGKIEPKKSDE